MKTISTVRKLGGKIKRPIESPAIIKESKEHATSGRLRGDPLVEGLLGIGAQQLNGLVHDLRNGLAAIIISADYLQANGAVSRDQKLAQAVRSGAQYCSGIVARISRHLQGKSEHRSIVDLREMVEDFVRYLCVGMPVNIAIRLEASKYIPGVVADPTQLQQVLMNLCINARDAMPRGGKIVVSLDSIERADGCSGDVAEAMSYAILSVSDSGCGIPIGSIDRIFDPSYSTKIGGKRGGIGLVTTKEIVASHGGFLTVESEVGRGSTFRVFLPHINRGRCGAVL